MCRTNNCGKILIFSVAIWLLYLCVAFGVPTDTQDSLLYFQLSKDTVFVMGSTGTGDTIAYVYLSVKDGAPRSGIDEMQFIFTLDLSVVHIIEVSPTDNWLGTDIHCDTIDSGTKIQVKMSSSYVSSITTDTVYVPYARLKCYLSCVDETTGKALTLTGTENYNYIEGPVEPGRLQEYPPNNSTHLVAGEIRSADYEATTRIDTVVVEGGLLKQATVPVYFNCNFRIKSIYQFLTFDTSLISFDTGYAAEPALWHFGSSIACNKDTIKVTLFSLTSVPEFSTPDELYYLKFTCKNNGSWNDSTYKAHIRFRPNDSCYILPYASTVCNSLKKSYTLSPESPGAYIRLEIADTVVTDIDCADCDSVVSLTDTTLGGWVKAKSKYPAGDTDNYIVINYNLGNRYRIGEVFDDTASTRVHFDCRQPNTSLLGVFQAYDDSLPNFYPESDTPYKMFRLNLKFLPGSYTPDYSNKKLEIKDTSCVYGYNTAFKDTTGSLNPPVIRRQDSVTVLVGEFSLTNSSTGNCTATQELRVRNNVNLTNLSLTLTLSSDSVISIYDVTTTHNIRFATSVNGKTGTFFGSRMDTIYANGEGYTKIADITYEVICSCTPGIPRKSIATMSAGTMYYSSTAKAFVAYGNNGTTITINCPSGVNNCSCGGDPKLATQENPLTPKAFQLYPCRPNPFNMQTTIAFDLPKASNVVLEIRNILGEKVATIVNCQMEAGRHEVIWDGKNQHGKDVATGVYLYNLRAGSYSSNKKMVLLK